MPLSLDEGPLGLRHARVQNVEELPQDELQRAWASVPKPKFAYFAALSGANFGFDKDTSKFMILVSFMDQKVAR